MSGFWVFQVYGVYRCSGYTVRRVLGVGLIGFLGFIRFMGFGVYRV